MNVYNAMNLYFDNHPLLHDEGTNDPTLLHNFINSDAKTSGGQLCFGTAPVANEAWENGYGVTSCLIREDHFAICVGVNTNPDDWAGWNEGQKPFTRYLSEMQKRKMREGKCILVLDSSLEGYHDERLWPWFHQVMAESELPIQSLVFITGNYKAESQYRKWIFKNGIHGNTAKVIGHCHFEKAIGNKFIFNSASPLSVNRHINYKSSNETLTFNVMQKRPRLHRCWFYSTLKYEGFLTKGIFSMQKIPFDHPDDYTVDGKRYTYDLEDMMQELPCGPDNSSKSDAYYIERLNSEVTLQTWFTVISEASFFDNDCTTFVSEKTFKAIGLRSPFIIFGNRGSLKVLKELGYKTFSDFWDESYDDLPTWERYNAIIKLMHDIDKIPDKMSLFEEMRQVLDYNYYTLMRNSSQPNTSFTKLKEYYTDYLT